MAANAVLIVGAVLGALMVVLGGVFFPVFDKIIHDEVVKQVILSNPDSTGYGEWKDPPGTIYMQFWFFDLVNKAEVKNGEAPYFVEVGPFTYVEYKPKGNITLSENKTTVNYTTTSTYVFDRNMSFSDPDYKITTVNIPLLVALRCILRNASPKNAQMKDHTAKSVADKLKYESAFIQKIVLEALATLEDEDIIYEVSVQDLLWGYEDPMLKLLKRLAPSLVPETTFGIFVGRNGSNDGVYEVYTGEDDYMQINNIRAWRGMTQLEWWTTDQANAINGSDGSYNHPFWNKDDDAYVFSSDICRSIIVKFEKESWVRGIPTYKFSSPDYAMLNGTAYPPNAGFCLPDLDHCLPSGLLNVSKCQLGAPIIMSLPHFLFADQEKVIDLVGGISPDPEQHNTYFHVEPLTGGPLEVAKRIQINVYMESFSSIDQMKNLPTLAFPILWLNESAKVTEDGATSLKKSLTIPVLITTAVKWGLIGLGAIILILCLTCLVKRRQSRRRSGSDVIVNSTNGDLSQPPLEETRPLLS